MLSLPLCVREWIIDPLRSLAFPPICPACGSSLPDATRDLCRDCAEALDAAVLPAEALHRVRAAFRAAAVLDDVLVLFYFDRQSPLQVLIHRMKYAGASSVGHNLGIRLGSVLARERVAGEFTGIVPVPLHSGRRRERGYNQAGLIARGIGSVLSLPVFDALLVRQRSTASQTGLTAAERTRNVAGAFTVYKGARELVREGRFLIVDDVLTTGATIEACARALKDEGAVCCSGAAVALAR